MEKAVQYRTALYVADQKTSARLGERYQPIWVVGAPRTGGSYLTAELIRAMGYDPLSTPALIAHDGFPDIKSAKHGRASWVRNVDALSEYLALLPLFFSRRLDGRIVVAKKFPKAVNCWDLMQLVFGAEPEILITVRDPISCCVSTYEIAGGLPEDGRFRLRSTIERWMLQSAVTAGVSRAEVFSQDYFSVYQSFWELFYSRVALSGSASGRMAQIVSFSKDAFEAVAAHAHRRFGSGLEVRTFQVSEPGVKRHPAWRDAAIRAVYNVGAVWHSCGLLFPVEQLIASLSAEA